MKFGSMPSTQPYLDPCLGMSRTFDADLRMGFQIKNEFLNLVLYLLKRKEFKYRSPKFARQTVGQP